MELSFDVGPSHIDLTGDLTGGQSTEMLLLDDDEPFSPNNSNTPNRYLVQDQVPAANSEKDKAKSPVAAPQDHYMQLQAMFPDVPTETFKFLLDVTKNNLEEVCECLVEPTLEGVVDLLSKHKLINDSRPVRVDDEDDEDVESLAQLMIAYYKGNKFDPHAPIRIRRNHPAVDTGGVRRQVYNDVFATFASSEKLLLFEGWPGGVRPVYRQSAISSGVLRLFGMMVAHSILQDVQGFPYLSDACYFYLAGNTEKALSMLTLDDVGSQIKSVVNDVSEYLVTHSPSFSNCVIWGGGQARL